MSSRRKWDVSNILDLPKMKSRLQALTPNGLRKSNFLFLYIFFSVVLFLAEAARFTDSTLRRKFRSNNRFLRNFSHEKVNHCPNRIDCLVD